MEGVDFIIKAKGKKILVTVVTYNHEDYIKKVLEKFPNKRNYDVLILDDCSTDNTWKIVKECNFKGIRNKVNIGVGSNIKNGIKYAIRNNYDVFVCLAGNGKDDPKEIPLIIKPIINENYDFVQSSRFLGQYKNIPYFRIFAVKAYSKFFSIITKQNFSDVLSGFRAYKVNIFKDKRINIWKDWLNGYEFETYLVYKLSTLNYKIKEVGVTRIYPKNKYSHIRPIIDWWNIIKPIFYLKLGIKK